ncbi:KR domain-containing protein [Hypomontagnella monticulosa]|nr:KR domain-containing protein [Hypomontagnella monticulosa]
MPELEPIAICGIGLRLPGGIQTTESFWDVLCHGKDTRGPIPSDRFNIDAFNTGRGKKGAVSTRHGYFLREDIAHFDASFFNMSKSELEKMDPQQRQILEVIRECLENAGEVDYRDKLVGCYVGTFGEDWLQSQSKDNQITGTYNLGGSGDFMIANRISYEYGFRGPSIVIKTACSASLIALHEACRALQYGDCTAALVAGTSLIMGPTMYATLSSEGFLSPEGSCKTFDSSADGYTRAEGINAVYIKRLSDALRQNNPIRAVIRNTGTNNDGKSQGLMTPSSAAQEALMRKVYEDISIDPRETAFIECHGTGTPIGDPIETTAVGNVFGERGIYIGSVKPNFGHGEGASGLTSLIKGVLALEQKTIPPNIKFMTPNPKIPFELNKLTVPLVPTPWPKGRADRISINSFGVGGSNAHVILESTESFVTRRPLNLADSKNTASVSRLLLFSANSEESLVSFTRKCLEYQQEHPGTTDDLAYTLAQRREKLPYRSYAVVANGVPRESSGIVKSSSQKRHIVMAFTGQGAQWPRMGQDLLENNEGFRKDLEEMDLIIASMAEAPAWTIKGELQKPESTSEVYRAQISQPLCTAIQIGLFNILKRTGILPSAVIGHSSGEIAAAYAAGALSMREAMVLAYYRGLEVSRHSQAGGMAVVGLGVDEVSPYLPDGVVIAAENSSNSTTISGDIKPLEEVLGIIRNQTQDVLARRLRIDTAYHSHHMIPVGDRLLDTTQAETKLSDYASWVPNISSPMFSTVTGQLVDHPLDPAYWVLNLTSPVKFISGFRSLLASSPIQPLVIEVGPHSQLSGPIREICTSLRTEHTYVPTMIRSKNCTGSLLAALGQLFQHGVGLRLEDSPDIIPNGNVLTNLPLYQWDHSARYWYENRISRDWRFRQYGHHSLLGQQIPQIGSAEPQWRVMLDLEDEPWLCDHKVGSDIVFPFSGYVAMAGEAIRQVTGIEEGYNVKHVVAHTALVLTEGNPVEIQTILRKRKPTDSLESDYYDFVVMSYSGTAWVKHCDGSVKPLRKSIDCSPLINPLGRNISPSRWYEILARVGYNYGPSFHSIDSLEASATERRALGGLKETATHCPYLFHPTTMDSCIQLIITAKAQGLSRNLTTLCVPTLIEELDVFSMSDRMIAEAWYSENMSDTGVLCVANGRIALRLRGARLTPFETDSDEALDRHHAARLEWHPHVDFLEDPSSLFDLPTLDNSSKVILEEISILSLLDSAERVKGLIPGHQHYSKYREWLFREQRRLVHEKHEFVDNAQEFVNMASEERLREIGRRFLARSIHAVQQNIDDLFTDDVLYRFYDSVTFGLARFIGLLCISKPNLRILEVGAGTGGTTEPILKSLVKISENPPFSCYTYTDISSGFFPKAASRFSYVPNMEYKVLDISRDPIEQGFSTSSYDLILAPNVIHATENLQTSLRHLRSLLKPDGQLLALEVCPTAVKVLAYVFGHLSGWWLGEADDREWEPYVQLDRWDRELKAAGFSGIDSSVLDAEEPYQYSAAFLSRAQPDVEISQEHIQAVTVLCENPDGTATRKVITALESRDVGVFIGKLEDSLPQDRPIIVTLDLEGYFFQDITEERLASFQKLCKQNEGQKLLWLMPPTQIHCSDPRCGQTIGALRVSRQELAVPFHTLEIDESEEHYTDLVLSVLRKICSHDDSETLSPDREFAVDGGIVKIGRYQPFSLDDELRRRDVDDSPYKHLNTNRPQRSEKLHWVSGSETDLNDGEVEIETRAVGISSQPVTEVSGTITRVGSDVHHVMVGDRVVAVSSDGCFATRVVLKSSLCVKISDDLSLIDACTMPAAFVTALQALVHIGQVLKGKMVLIHEACSNIGHAAIQLCQNLGAEVFVTADSEAKIQYVEGVLGVQRRHIFNSGDDSFVDDVMRETQGEGVDIVLGSHSSKFFYTSWECVAEFGKMIEFGNRDPINSGQLDMRPFSSNRSYSCVNLVHMIQKCPEQVGKLMQDMANLYREGQIRPIRERAEFEAQDIELAFRHLQQGEQIGHTIILMPEDTMSLQAIPETSEITFDPNASYLLTGGLGGVGRSLARWMAEHGARSLVFLSRSAGKDEHDQQFFQELELMGCTSTAISGYVGDKEDVRRAVAEAPTQIKGVIHLAMVLRDELIANMTHEEWTSVVSPKVEGAWTLHNVFIELKQSLDFVVVTSSILTVTDQPGQSNYAAANTFLESFCQYRRAHGLPACALAMCPIDDVGFVADNQSIRKQLKSRGFCFLSEKEMLEHFQLALMNQYPINGPTSMNAKPMEPWTDRGHILMGLHSEISLNNPECRVSWHRDRRMGLYHNVKDTVEDQTGSSNGLEAFIERATGDTGMLLQQDNIDYIATEIGRQIFQLMMKDATAVDITLALDELGMDSLMAIELRRWWKRTLRHDISVLEIMGAGKLQQLGKLASDGLLRKYAGEE